MKDMYFSSDHLDMEDIGVSNNSQLFIKLFDKSLRCTKSKQLGSIWDPVICEAFVKD